MEKRCLLKTGIVIKTTGSQYWVRENDGTQVLCRIKGAIRLRELKTTNPAVVGDIVRFSMEDNGREGVIESIGVRHNYIVRKSIKLSSRKHIIAANIDRVVIVATLSHPKTHLEFIDRYLVTAEAYHVPVILVFNKTDLYDAQSLKKLDEVMDLYRHAGYKCLSISAKKAQDFSAFRQLFEGGTTLISGHSGVGKSTLINRISPGLDLRTSEISQSHQAGKHTTTYAQMHELPGLGFVIDTPGIKGLGVLDIPKEELSHYFLEMRVLLSDCKYNNCVHMDEPDCAVKKALNAGHIAASRYRSYVSIFNESSGNFRTVEYQ